MSDPSARVADFSFEHAAFAQGFRCVVGVDEVGRGPLAGPVTAAAVRLDPGGIPDGVAEQRPPLFRRSAGLVGAQRVHRLKAADGRLWVNQ